ncbi:nicotinate-nucleotide adenylyltransferase [Metamycoplasma buccale]|uniref:nicotinate-nucleotide adenylyltransferase n=1 Tax=Metamycoplasma buccale TaxID=55602 RepID=UPI00398EA8D6
MKIAIFGGSFNPIHKGHILIAKEAIQKLNLDKLFFVPAYKSPFKKNVNYVSEVHRTNMINLVMEEKMYLSTFELNKKNISYTIDTVKYFSQKFPNDELYLLIGSDNVNNLNKWKQIDIISKLAKIVIFERGNKYQKINIKKFNCLKLNNSIYPFSSTDYRKGNLLMVENIVQEYIGANFLYFDEIAKNMMSIERYKHLKFTADFALELAKKYNFDIQKAYQAGFMHDIAKEWDEENSYNFLKKYGYSKENLPFYKLHQTVGYFYLKDVYKYKNEDVLNSIKIHTSLKLDQLSILDKILFISDKICQGRKWGGIQKVRELAFQNLDEALKVVIQKCCIEYNNNLGKEITSEQWEIYNKLLK